MGALTGKRFSADQRPPSPTPPSKRPKFAPPLPISSPPPLYSSSHLPSPPPSAAPGPTSSTAATASTSSSPSSSLPHRRRRRPQPPEPPRNFHAPQRASRAFRRGNIRSNSNPSRDSSSPPPQDRGLDQYLELVKSVDRHPPPLTPSAADAPRGPEDAAEVITIDDREDIEQDDDKDNEDELEAKVVVGKVPLYKELLEASNRQRDPRIRELEFKTRLAEKERLGLEQLAKVLPQITPNKKEVPEPFVPLTAEDEDRVRHALGGRKRRETLSVHEPSNIVITREILQCLNDKDWLNDEVINLYLELLKERELKEPNKFVKCHFFNTFFYKKLINGGYDYKAVRRWTTKRKLGYNLIDCDKIFVPIHKEVHWCLAVINIRDKKFQYLDSLGSMDTKALKLLARYLVDEVKEKSGNEIDVLSWKQEGVQNLPLQENGWDCGMFMLKYIDFYSRDMDLIFGQKDMPYFRRRTAKEILDLRAG
ncbi:putative ubiquitin-like-specific protease 1B [Lolium rigidum]|uniref:putative ubiquitin-like-specific protease 1B n=1 Tax=Lolium rigidum TaxID=89674 RepID=UPI001F5C5BAC|nr:putative ubiquitin-like-specific protease 1B [Lolium rigidum]